MYHIHSTTPNKDLRLAIIITLIIFFVEFLGGFISNSLALISDSFHMLADVFALLITFISLSFARSLPTKSRTFGLHRAEILAALFNGILLLIVTGFIVSKAIIRLLYPSSIHAPSLLIFAIIGFLANIYILTRLRKYHDVNVKGALLHVAADTLSSLAVIIGGVVLMFTNLTIIDPILSILIAIAIIYTSFEVISDALNILLQSVPKGLDLDKIINDIKKIKKIKDLQSVQLWSLCSNVNVMTAHVKTTSNSLKETKKITEKINKKVQKYNIKHTTFQFE